MTLLELNGYKFAATQKEVVNFALNIVKKKTSLKEIASWLKTHSIKKN